MSLLTDASLLLTPNANATGKFYSIIPSNGNGDFTGTRATTATRVNSSGLVEVTGLNMIRRDYSLGSCPNILLEPQRTNLALRSEEFDNAIWTKLGSTITANSIISPDGTLNADTITRTGLSTFNPLASSPSVTSGTTYTFSVYAKKGTNDFIQIFSTVALFTANFFANFDLNTGVVGTVGSATTASSIQSVGNGWYRCTVTGPAVSTGSSNSFSISLVTSASALRAQSNTLTTSVSLWGAQLELGLYATSYIPTTSTTVTRNLDQISRNNIFTNGLITASGGTWFVELKNNVPVVRDLSTSGIYLNTGVTSTTGSGFVLRNPGVSLSRIGIFKVEAGALSTNLHTIATDNAKVAFKWNGTTADIFVNGVKVVAATSFAFTAMQNLIAEGANRAIQVNEMALFPTPLTDTQCIALTT